MASPAVADVVEWMAEGRDASPYAILIADDDAELSEALTVGFEMVWPYCRVQVARSGEQAVALFEQQQPSVVLLDLCLPPPPDGFEVLNHVRRRSEVPVLVISGQDSVDDKVRALEMGADDFLCKPFGSLELIARIRSLLRRMQVPKLMGLLGIEATARRERYLLARTRLAHFPFHRTLEQFDFAFQPSVDERQVRELAALAFVADGANLLLLGPPGVGKTHLEVALGIRAIEQGYGVYFVRAHELLEDLRRAQAEDRLDRRMRVYLTPKLLIIDEFGVWPYDRVAATAFFTLISARYERGSILLTSNRGFAEWGEVLGDSVVASAILDRLLHHSYVLSIRGESYRLREKKRAGLFTTLPVHPNSSDYDQREQDPGPQPVGQFQSGENGSKLTRR